MTTGDVFAEPPDEHRDLPNDLLAIDRTCTITAWAKGDREVASPVAALKVRPIDTDRGAVNGFRDCQLASPVDLTNLVPTKFTVLKEVWGRLGSRYRKIALVPPRDSEPTMEDLSRTPG